MTDSSHSNSGRPKTSRTELINELKRLADKFDRTPTFADMTEHGKYSGVLYVNRFDSWNEAVEAAGLTPNDQNQPRYTDDELLTHLQEFATQLDTDSPSSKKMNSDGPHNSKTYKDRFGSWNKALKEAGLEPKEPLQTRHTKQDLLDDLVELAQDIGHIPTQKEIREYTNHSHNTYYNHWGSVKDALKASNVDLDAIDMSRKTKPYSIDRQELLDELRRLADELDRPPRWTDIREHSTFSDSPYRSRFDSLEDAYREAGIQLDH